MRCNSSLLAHAFIEMILAFQDTHVKMRLESADARTCFNSHEPLELPKLLLRCTLTQARLGMTKPTCCSCPIARAKRKICPQARATWDDFRTNRTRYQHPPGQERPPLMQRRANNRLSQSALDIGLSRVVPQQQLQGEMSFSLRLASIEYCSSTLTPYILPFSLPICFLSWIVAMNFEGATPLSLPYHYTRTSPTVAIYIIPNSHCLSGGVAFLVQHLSLT